MIVLDSVGQMESIKKGDKYRIIYGKANPENTRIKYIPSTNDDEYILEVVYYEDLIQERDPLKNKYNILETEYKESLNRNIYFKKRIDSIEKMQDINLKYLDLVERIFSFSKDTNDVTLAEDYITQANIEIDKKEENLEKINKKININKNEYQKNLEDIEYLKNQINSLKASNASNKEINIFEDKLLTLLNRNEFLLKENQNLYFEKFALVKNINTQIKELKQKNQRILFLNMDKQLSELKLKKEKAEAAKKEKEIAYLEKKHAFNVVLQNSLVGGFLLLGVIVLLLLIFFKRKSKDNKKLILLNEKIGIEQLKTDALLQNILPSAVANRLKEGEVLIADHFEEASIIFIDIVNFTKLSSSIPAEDTISILNNLFTKLDGLCEKFKVEKIKTIGDCYMAVSGVPEPKPDHAYIAAEFALEALENVRTTCNIDVRIGIDCGSVVAGIIGQKKFIYDLWGDAVNTASRMEEYGLPGKIQVTTRFKEKIEMTDKKYNFIERGSISIKGKGKMNTWIMNESLELMERKSKIIID